MSNLNSFVNLKNHFLTPPRRTFRDQEDDVVAMIPQTHSSGDIQAMIQYDHDNVPNQEPSLYYESKLHEHQIQIQEKDSIILELRTKQESLQRELLQLHDDFDFRKAEWMDQMLSLQIECDAKIVSQQRRKEAVENILLEQELEKLRISLDEKEGSEEHTIQEEKEKEETIPENESSSHQYSIPDTRVEEQEVLIQNLNAQIQELNDSLKDQKTQHEAELANCKASKINLEESASNAKQDLQEANERIKWLETELLTAYPSDTDDDEREEDTFDNNQGIKEGGGNAILHPRFAEKILQESEGLKRARRDLDRQIDNLNQYVHEIEAEKKMEEAMSTRQIIELEHQIQEYQFTIQQETSEWEKERQGLVRYQQELIKRMEDLEMDNLRLREQCSGKQQQYDHEVRLQKQNNHDLQAQLEKSRQLVIHYKLKLERYKEREVKGGEKALNNEEAHESVKDDAMKNTTKEQDEERERAQTKLLLEELQTNLKQADQREVSLQKDVEEKDNALKATQQELEAAQERIQMLMAYLES